MIVEVLSAEIRESPVSGNILLRLVINADGDRGYIFIGSGSRYGLELLEKQTGWSWSLDYVRSLVGKLLSIDKGYRQSFNYKDIPFYALRDVRMY